ncbi:dTDP-4-dehydrorhamnose 3,5-epimerase family protein [Chenggangzhangella methanolivorans]|uniref:dTDP-4-dehydrorhamnose 3,5-epimerase n=1 Tax=Chenggangzhangella methanolivorans TaxID=1437009 RepID=A0A9E6RC68_9HYPH|nr:dTDP-4-dehydrorhamnose 3,5-epimerase family protein [Chenggangzhangella methanolivorans]QZO01170.1 dTDP-4-dehydrorhamnose 3,5-epimerase family protein [Chenggangzhangella methanolivorans]
MRFTRTRIDGALIVDLEPRSDDRGFFARAFCVEEFRQAGVAFECPQINLSRNHAARTLRGMHYRDFAHAEAKFVRVVRGRAWDVAVDVRPDSPTFGDSVGVELGDVEGRGLYLAKGLAHGFLTLEPDTDMLYLMSDVYTPQHERGLRWNDPALAIDWPERPLVISERDATYPDFSPTGFAPAGRSGGA